MNPLSPSQIQQVAGGTGQKKPWYIVSPGSPDLPDLVLLPINEIPDNPLQPPPPPVDGNR